MNTVWSAVLPALLVVLSPAIRADEPRTTGAKKADTPKIAVFKLSGSLEEKPAGDDLFGVGGTSLKDLVERMRKASADPTVKAVVLTLENASIGTAQKEELRQAIAHLRGAGKDVLAHADSLQMGEYALLCGANRLSVVPTGDLWVTGMFGEQMFLRGLLDKLGAQPDFLTCGTHKSAAELFMRSSPSPESHAMQNWLMDSIFETYVDLIAKGRGVDAAKAKSWIDEGPYSAERAKAAGMIDAVEHRQVFETHIKAKYGSALTYEHKYGEKKQPTIDFGNPFSLFKLLADAGSESKKKHTKPAVAVVYVEGPIAVGKSQPSPFGMAGGGAYSTEIRKALDEAARDDSVKAVVLRVNSPGGSAVASEIILDATKRVKAKKPFVVSMGDVAGSGGYYVACGADTIFADAATITGSIGVVSGKLVTNPMWAKAGINFTPYQRGKNAGMLSSATPFSQDERQRMQSYMDEIYGVFKGHVMAARGDRLKKKLDDIAGGRVYTGKQALELGLVDKLGTFRDAVEYVAAQAKLDQYEIRSVPEPKNLIEQIMESAGGGSDDPKRLDSDSRVIKLTGPSLLELAAPHLRDLDPQRVKLIRTALQQLQTLQHEGVCLMMPELFVK